MNAKKLAQPDDRTPFAQSTPEKFDQMPPVPRAVINLNPNQRAGRAHVHLVASVFQVRHIKKPMIAEPNRDRLQIFQRTPAIVRGWNISPISISRRPAPKTATQILRIRIPAKLIARRKRGLESELQSRLGLPFTSRGSASRLRRRSSSASADLASSRSDALSAESISSSSSVFEE